MTTAELTNALNLVLEGIQAGLIEIKVRSRAKREPQPKRFKHQIGDVFNGFKLVERLGGVRWMVECPHCGALIERQRNNTVNGLVRCDCQRKNKKDELLQRPVGNPSPSGNNQYQKKEEVIVNNVNDYHIERPTGNSKAAATRRIKQEITRYGDWDVVAKDGPKWTIECRNCGHKITRTGSYVRSLKVKCACNPDYDPRGRKPNEPDVVRVHLSPGTRFGRLFVSEFLGINDQGEQLYWANCLCGGSINVTRHQLETSAVQSCGCQK